MTDAKQQQAAKDFAEYWKDRGYEKGETTLMCVLRSVVMK